MEAKIKHNQIIKAAWPCCTKSDFNAVVIYPADETLKKEYGITECAWVEYQDTLVEAFFFSNEAGWELDDIGLGETRLKDTPNGYPGSTYLKGTGWELKPSFSEYAKDYFWEPIKLS